MKAIKKIWYRVTNWIPGVQKRRQKKMLIGIGAGLMEELKHNRNLRRSVIKNAPKLHAILNYYGISIKQ